MVDPNADTKTEDLLKQVTILFDDEGLGFDIKVFLPDGREVEIDILEEEDVSAD